VPVKENKSLPLLLALMKEMHGRETECWVYPGKLNRQGYGQVSYTYGSMGAYRAAYIISKGEPPKYFEIDHLCRNRACVNPAHLEAVPQSVNAYRGALYWRNLRIAAGLPVSPVYDSEELIIKRKYLMLQCDLTARKIATRLKVHEAQVSRVINGKSRAPRIQKYLAKKWGVPIEEVFPND
jgi:hypothetical protein